MFIPHLFLEILQKYCKLVILVLCAGQPTKSNSINLQETLRFICKSKINLIPQCILEILDL